MLYSVLYVGRGECTVLYVHTEGSCGTAAVWYNVVAPAKQDALNYLACGELQFEDGVPCHHRPQHRGKAEDKREDKRAKNEAEG